MSSLRSKLLARRLKPVPPGWLTSEDVARREGISRETVRLTIRDALAARPPLLQRREFLVLWGNTVRRRAYYRYL